MLNCLLDMRQSLTTKTIVKNISNQNQKIEAQLRKGCTKK